MMTRETDITARAVAAAQAVMMGSTYHKDAVRAFLDKHPLPFDWERFDRAEKAAE